jgi:hypothetical protein
MSTNKLTAFLNGAAIGQPQTHANMAVYPLRVKNGHKRNYQTLDEAMQARTIEVLEVSEGGSVPNLKVRNTGSLPVLLVVGEELVGAKQNRVLNTSLLVPAQKEIEVPVSCVERGRWAYNSRAFDTSTTSSHFKLRKAQVEKVTDNLRTRAAFDADQSAVWQEIDRKIHTTGSISNTAALHDVYTQTEDDLKNYLAAFPPPDAEGVIVTINGQIAGADIFDHSDTLRALWPKLLRSYALDALERRSAREGAQPPADVQGFLAAVQNAKDERYDSVGLGEDVRLSNDHVTGSSLLWGDQVIHASLFNKA